MPTDSIRLAWSAPQRTNTLRGPWTPRLDRNRREGHISVKCFTWKGTNYDSQVTESNAKNNKSTILTESITFVPLVETSLLYKMIPRLPLFLLLPVIVNTRNAKRFAFSPQKCNSQRRDPMCFSPSPTVPETSHCATTSSSTWTGKKKKEEVKKKQ